MKNITGKRLAFCEEIKFTLHQTRRADKAGKPCYAAALVHGTDRYSRENIDILAEESDIRDMGITPGQARTVVGAVVDLMVKKTLTDGVTRRFGDLFEVRLDIAGRFSRIDEPFDPDKHRLKVNLVPLKALSSAYVRSEMPVNERRMPKGRIDYVTYPGGEMGEVKVGEDIIVRGHDLYLDKCDTVAISWAKPNGDTERRTIGNWTDMERFLKVNTPQELRIAWFLAADEDFRLKPGTSAKLFVDTQVARRNQNRGRGTASDIIIRQ